MTIKTLPLCCILLFLSTSLAFQQASVSSFSRHSIGFTSSTIQQQKRRHLPLHVENTNRDNNDIPLPFFPRDNVLKRWSRKFQKASTKQFVRLQKAGRSGLLAYGFLNFILYSGGTLWQWHRVTGGPTLQHQITRLGKVLGAVYIGSQVTKPFRIALAVAMAPMGNRSLIWLQTKLRISEGFALAILMVSMIVTFLGVLASLTIGSTLIA